MYKRQFYLCEKLKTVSLPESLHSIRSDAFRQCKTLESIRISENVDSIGSNSFQGCIGLMRLLFREVILDVYKRQLMKSFT